MSSIYFKRLIQTAILLVFIFTLLSPLSTVRAQTDSAEISTNNTQSHNVPSSLATTVLQPIHQPTDSQSTSSSPSSMLSYYHYYRKQFLDSLPLQFISAFFASVSMILVSEFGDKTFFIAAILAMRRGRKEIFLSAISALALMTVLSAALGHSFTAVLDPKITHLAASGLFVFFGFKLLFDAYKLHGSGSFDDEMEEVEEELQSSELNEANLEGSTLLPMTTLPGKKVEVETGDILTENKISYNRNSLSGRIQQLSQNIYSVARRFFGKSFLQCFTMTFLAEWGDRSQIATIALAAEQDAIGVTIGGIVGHAICTGFAVLSGRFLASRISERTIYILGGVLFIIFAFHSLYYGNEHSP
jgi:putative Ca2+/H+ antiporter (TMEM165/GDT1 family)